MPNLPAQWLLTCLLITGLAQHAAAESFRCKNDLVRPGDDKASVIQKCGEPVLKDKVRENCQPGEVVNVINDGPASSQSRSYACGAVEEWTYQPPAGQLLAILRFENGKVQSIRYGDRVR